MAKKLDFKDFLTVDYAPGMPGQIKKNAKKRKMDSGGGTNAEYSSTISPEEDINTIDEAKGALTPYDLPNATGKHASNVGMGYTGKHKTLKDKPYKKHVHVYQFTGEEADLDELSMSVKDFKKTGLNKTVTKDKDKLKKDLEAMKARLNKEEVEEVDEALSLQQRRALSRRMKLKRKKIEVGRKRALARAADPARLKKRAQKAARNALFKKLSKGKSRDELPPQRRAEIEKRMAKMGNRITRLATKLLPQVRKMDKERRVSKKEK
jgi:hypothetical protein